VAELLSQERLQPSLLDRLTDDEPLSKTESTDKRVLNKQQLKQGVLRDLQWLLNTSKPSAKTFAKYPHVQKSVLNFGMPALAGETADSVGQNDVQEAVKDAIRWFEPRIDADTLDIRAASRGSYLDAHNVLELQVRGTVWAQPTPLELILKTSMDLETGQVAVKEMSGSGRK
jgi:type VI secretion system protein ImpF